MGPGYLCLMLLSDLVGNSSLRATSLRSLVGCTILQKGGGIAFGIKCCFGHHISWGLKTVHWSCSTTVIQGL